MFHFSIRYFAVERRSTTFIARVQTRALNKETTSLACNSVATCTVSPIAMQRKSKKSSFSHTCIGYTYVYIHSLRVKQGFIASPLEHITRGRNLSWVTYRCIYLCIHRSILHIYVCMNILYILVYIYSCIYIYIGLSNAQQVHLMAIRCSQRLHLSSAYLPLCHGVQFATEQTPCCCSRTQCFRQLQEEMDGDREADTQTDRAAEDLSLDETPQRNVFITALP